MGEVRVVATDIDGTVFNSHHEVPAENAAAMRAATEQGVKVVVCTGKMAGPWSETMLEALELGTYSVYNNGGLILDGAGNTVYEAALERQLVLDILAALDDVEGEMAARVVVSVGGLDYRFALFAEQENYVSEFIASAGENPPEVVGPLPAFLERESGVGVNKMFLCVRHDGADGAADFDEVCAAVEKAAAGRAELLVDAVTWWSETTAAIEVMPLGQSKAQGMAFVLEQLGEEPANMLAIGDGTNDVAMLTMAREAGGVSVAMGNGNAAVHAAAEHATGTNEEAGMAAALRKFVLSEAPKL